jgi:hypothetical protein
MATIIITSHEAIGYQVENCVLNYTKSRTVCFGILITAGTFPWGWALRRVGVDHGDTVISVNS